MLGFLIILYGGVIMVRLLELRSEKALSQREIAKLLNISQGTYNNWENGKTEPSIEDLIELSRFFKVSVDYLIGNQKDEVSINLDKEEVSSLRKVYRSIQKLDEDGLSALSVIIEKMVE